MAKENVIITSTYAGKTLQKTLTDVNPAATNAQLKTFATKLVGLTDNTYQKTDRVTKVNCDTTPGGGEKPEPTLTLSANSVTKAEAVEATTSGRMVYIGPTITTNSDGNIYIRPPYLTDDGGAAASSAAVYCSLATDNGAKKIYMHVANQVVAPATVYIGVTETDNYAAKEVAFTITA